MIPLRYAPIPRLELTLLGLTKAKVPFLSVLNPFLISTRGDLWWCEGHKKPFAVSAFFLPCWDISSQSVFGRWTDSSFQPKSSIFRLNSTAQLSSRIKFKVQGEQQSSVDSMLVSGTSCPRFESLRRRFLYRNSFQCCCVNWQHIAYKMYCEKSLIILTKPD